MAADAMQWAGALWGRQWRNWAVAGLLLLLGAGTALARTEARSAVRTRTLIDGWSGFIESVVRALAGGSVLAAKAERRPAAGARCSSRATASSVCPLAIKIRPRRKEAIAVNPTNTNEVPITRSDVAGSHAAATQTIAPETMISHPTSFVMNAMVRSA